MLYEVITDMTIKLIDETKDFLQDKQEEVFVDLGNISDALTKKKVMIFLRTLTNKATTINSIECENQKIKELKAQIQDHVESIKDIITNEGWGDNTTITADEIV